jgi:MerR family redox-sensitive transcriptional activator SoxR
LTGDRRHTDARSCDVAVIRSAQNVGLSLDEIASALAVVGPEDAPTKREWHRMSAAWRPALDARIDALQALRSNLDSCIGCGCLSMRQCTLYNPQDEPATRARPRRKVAVLDPSGRRAAGG